MNINLILFICILCIIYFLGCITGILAVEILFNRGYKNDKRKNI